MPLIQIRDGHPVLSELPLVELEFDAGPSHYPGVAYGRRLPRTDGLVVLITSEHETATPGERKREYFIVRQDMVRRERVLTALQPG
jgi:hypothetical protein